MGLISKQTILATKKNLKFELVDVPEWGGEVIICELTGKQRDAFEASIVQMGSNGSRQMNLQNLRARLASKCIADPDDFDIVEIIDSATNQVIKKPVLKNDRAIRRMFNDIEANDLGDLSASTLQRIFNASQRLSGITDTDVNELALQLKNDQSADFGIN